MRQGDCIADTSNPIIKRAFVLVGQGGSSYQAKCRRNETTGLAAEGLVSLLTTNEPKQANNIRATLSGLAMVASRRKRGDEEDEIEDVEEPPNVAHSIHTVFVLSLKSQIQKEVANRH